jgi:hypothetical protein
MLKPILFASSLAAVLTSTLAARADFATPPGAVAVVEPPAHALAVATPPPPSRDLGVAASKADKPDALMAIRFEGGPAWATMRPMGGYGRLTIEALAVMRPHGASPVFGIWEGIEGWGAKFGSAGVSVPVVGEAGFRAGPLVATLGAGINVITFEQLGKAKGIGGFSPRAGARIGLTLGSVYVVATGDVQRRWQVNIPTMTMYQAGLAVGVVLDPGKMK